MTALTEPRTPLSRAHVEQADALLERRLQREPLAYVLGYVTWRGMTLRVDARCLVPRPETEQLVDWALSATDSLEAGLVIDVGTGSGCLLCGFLAERPGWIGLGVDVSPAALSIAHENLTARAGTSRSWFLGRADSLHAIAPSHSQRVLVLANPPYVTYDEWARAEPEVRVFEPRAALLVPNDHPLEPYERLLGELARFGTRPALGMEVGLGRADSVADLVLATGYTDVEVLRDFAGIDRFVVARPSEWGA